MPKLTQHLNMNDLVNALRNGLKLPGHRIIDVKFIIGSKSDGYNDRDSPPGGIPYVTGVEVEWEDAVSQGQGKD